MSERYRQLPSDRSAADIESEVLERWRSERLFERTIAERAAAGAPPFVFFEGPPTANGRPGIHHVFSRTIKDLFCRHRHMRGFSVRRKAGWDTHGLPVEIEVEKKLGVSSKQEIEAFGVEEFNRKCRESVFTYRSDWEQLSERIGYWLDYADPYVTYTNDYIESVWWAIRTLHDKGLLYRGHKILPYCPRCGTALSSHEVAQGYEDVEDPSVYVALELRGDAQRRGSARTEDAPTGSRRRVLVWTTTPWTLVSNVALAVHPDLDYVELRKRRAEDGTLILAASRAAAVLGEDYRDRWETVGRLTGHDLVGARYVRPLDWVAIDAGEHEVIVGADFVSAEEGSGIVHMAPAFGADDYATGQRYGLTFLQPVDARGRFDAAIPLIGGMWVKDADKRIIEELRGKGVLWKATTLTHSYPHCWRCGTPLLYYARSSWFVRTTALRDRMLDRNERVEWHPPEVGHGRFGEWLKTNVDWAISRDRYWGTPLPVWVCDTVTDHVEVIGAYAALAERSGRALPNDFDPHKPFIDRHTWRCDRCASADPSSNATMRRVPEVIDAWFDSGSMPFAQWHYPFANRDVLASQYPADFIAEGLDQTRGWFYSLLAIATGLDDALPNNPPQPRAGDGHVRQTAPYRACVVNDLVLDANGVKMSKSKGNVVDPWEVIQRHGVDAVRLFLVSASQLDVPRRFDENTIRETSARFLVTLRNVYNGIFAQYANFGWEPSDADPSPKDRPVLDRWILSRLRTVEREVDVLMEDYDATASARLIMSFVVDDLSNWYVRSSRHRFFGVDSPDNRSAFATLREVLVVTSRLLAPLAPFLSDFMHRELTSESVHLASYVRRDADKPDPDLETAMAGVRELARLGRAAREEAGVIVRHPLSRLLCVVPSAMSSRVQELLPILAAELNVKRVELLTSADELVQLAAKPNFRSLGKRFGKATPLAAKAVEALDNEAIRAFERGEAIAISVDGRSHLLEPDDFTVHRRAAGALVVKEAGGYFAAIDPTITKELHVEGLARELVSRIQRMRKDTGLAVADRILLWIDGPDMIEEVIGEYKDWLSGEVLAREIRTGPIPASVEYDGRTVEIDGLQIRIALTPDH